MSTRVARALAVAGAVLVVAGPGPDSRAEHREPRFEERLSAAERSALTTLRQLRGAQTLFQESALADVDGDGVGEYGTLRELSGAAPVRQTSDGAASIDALRVVVPLVPDAFRELGPYGIATIDGYHYAVFLPDDNGDAVGESPWGPTVDGSVDADRCEVSWCAYAWPVRYRRATRWTFAIDAAGSVRATRDRWYSGRSGLFDEARRGISPANAGAAFAATDVARRERRRPHFARRIVETMAVSSERAADGNRWIDPGWSRLYGRLRWARAPRASGRGHRPVGARRIDDAELEAVATLQRLAAAQRAFQELRLVDLDGNGIGEFGTLRELSGAVNLREDRYGASSGVTGKRGPALLPPGYGELNANAELERRGYLFKVFLPDRAGDAVEETYAGDNYSVDGVLGWWRDGRPLAEVYWCAYAWPVRREKTGRRTFFVNQSAMITCSDGRDPRWVHGATEYSGTGDIDEANAGAAFADGWADTVTGSPAMGTVGLDGTFWRLVE